MRVIGIDLISLTWWVELFCVWYHVHVPCVLFTRKWRARAATSGKDSLFWVFLELKNRRMWVSLNLLCARRNRSIPRCHLFSTVSVLAACRNAVNAMLNQLNIEHEVIPTLWQRSWMSFRCWTFEKWADGRLIFPSTAEISLTYSRRGQCRSLREGHSGLWSGQMYIFHLLGVWRFWGESNSYPLRGLSIVYCSSVQYFGLAQDFKNLNIQRTIAAWPKLWMISSSEKYWCWATSGCIALRAPIAGARCTPTWVCWPAAHSLSGSLTVGNLDSLRTASIY